MAFKLQVELEGLDGLSPAVEEAAEAMETATADMRNDLDRLDDSIEETEDTAKGFGSTVKEFMSNPLRAASAGLAVAGLGFKAFVESTREGSQAVGITALNTGLLRGDLIDLAKELSNSTLKASDAARGFRELSTFGVTSAEDMRLIVSVADTISTAIGGDVVDAIGSLRTAAFAMNTTVKESAQDINALGAIAIKLGAEGVDRFARNVSQLGPTLASTGLGVKDFAAFMLAMGSTGGELSELLPKLRVELQRLGEEGADVNKVYEAVGLEFGFTTAELFDFREEVNKGQVAIEKQKDEMSRHLGVLSDFKSGLDDLKFEFGDILSPLTDLGEGMLLLAGTLFSLSVIAPVVKGALIAMATALAGVLGIGVLLASLIAILVIAVAALGLALIFDWGGIRTFWKEFFVDLFNVKRMIEEVKTAFTTLPWQEGGLFRNNPFGNPFNDNNGPDVLRVNENVRPGRNAGSRAFAEGEAGTTFVFQEQINVGEDTLADLADQVRAASGGTP